MIICRALQLNSVSLQMMQQLFQQCNLVHADLSEYNMLWHDGQVRTFPKSFSLSHSFSSKKLILLLSIIDINIILLQVWLIDVSQSVEPAHPHSLEFLFRDCRNVTTVSISPCVLVASFYFCILELNKTFTALVID